jgi:hypothetical protein
MKAQIQQLEEENRKLKEERDFFKEQAILWRKDYKNEYEKNKKLEEENRRLREAFEIADMCVNNTTKENKKLESEIENMKKVGRENIETLDRMSIELENYSESFKRYRDFSKQELADSLYDMEQENKKLKDELDYTKE